MNRLKIFLQRDFEKLEKIFKNSSLLGNIRAISSKSEAHRALICAAISDKKTKIICTDTNADIDATAACLSSLGANILRIEGGFEVTPISEPRFGATLDANESGSTLRFLLPLISSLGVSASFIMRGRLASRPLSPLYELLSMNGVSLSPEGESPLNISGRLSAGDYSLAANVSSQYISGMLFALAISEGKSRLTLEGKLESAPYLMMTLDTLLLFGADISFERESMTFLINGKKRLSSPSLFTVGGDWSNAAFPIVGGVIGDHPVRVSSLNTESRQGDKAVIDVLCRMGALIECVDGDIIAYPSRLHGTVIDAANIPDLVPILALAASVAEGETRICNASRLRLKESDRIESVCATLSSLGAIIRPTDDGMIIQGKPTLRGGSVDSYNDHRIAMCAAIASLVSENEVRIDRFEAISKSYPSFTDIWENED